MNNDLNNTSAHEQFLQGEWKSLICARCDLMLDYPPTVLEEILQPDDLRFKKELSIHFYDKTTGNFKLNNIIGTPNENVTFEHLKKLRDWWLNGDPFIHISL